MSTILAVDSDGCALDAMEVKHRRCFTPATLEVWGLAGVGERATEISLSINLYSRGRGLNRFTALRELFKRLSSDEGVSGVQIPDGEFLDRWFSNAGPLSEEGLLEYIKVAPEEDLELLERCLKWTRSVNARVAKLPAPEPFLNVKETLMASSARLSVHVVSSATNRVIRKEWKAAGLAPYVSGFHGQESGSKALILEDLANTTDGPDSVLMVGDAWADLEAAEASGTLFYPIEPGREGASWKYLREQILPTYLAGLVPTAALERRRARFAECLAPL